MPTVVSMVEKGCAATTDVAPVSALNRLDLPLFGRPTSPRRSTRGAYRRPFAKPVVGAGRGSSTTLHRPHDRGGRQHEQAQGAGYPGEQRAGPEQPGAQRRERGSMSKKTSKRKLRSRRNKANHGKRPNSGRR